MTRILIEGTIELDSNNHSKVKFTCDTEQGFWNQWGNTEHKMFKTVDIVTKIQEAISNIEYNDDIMSKLKIYDMEETNE